MGLVTTVVEFVRATVDGKFFPEIKYDAGGEDTGTAEYYTPAGDDSPPVAGDVLVVQRVRGTNRFSVVGVIDTVNEGVAAPGEKRFFARDADGAIVSSIYMKEDGSVHLAEDTAAALISRADRTDAEIKVVRDALASATATGLDPGDNGALYRTNILTALGEQGKTACDKVHGT